MANRCADDYLEWSTLKATLLRPTTLTTTFQLEAILFHSGILTERGGPNHSESI